MPSRNRSSLSAMPVLVQDLRASLDFGNTFADAASMLCRDEDEVRQKAKELGLVEGIVDQAMAAKVRPAVLGPQTQARTISCIAPLFCRGCGLRTPVRQELYRTGRCSHRWSLGPSG